MVSTHPLISKSCSFCIKSWWLYRARQFKFHVPYFFVFKILVLIFSFFNFTLWSARTVKFTIQPVCFFVNCQNDLLRLGDLFLSQNTTKFCAFHLSGRIPFVSMVKFKIPAQFPVDHISHRIMSCLILFCANLLHSIIMRLSVWSLSPHNLDQILCCILSILALT